MSARIEILMSVIVGLLLGMVLIMIVASWAWADAVVEDTPRRVTQGTNFGGPVRAGEPYQGAGDAGSSSSGDAGGSGAAGSGAGGNGCR